MSTLHRSFSVRSIFMFIAVVFITTLLWVTFGNSQTAHAADANWSGDSLIYDGHGFTKTTDYDDTTDTIPSGATVYQTPPQVVAGSDTKKVFIIYFSSGVDPPKATEAKYVEFTSSSNGLTNAQNKRDITLTVKGEEDEMSSCSVGGIGWIICPVSVYIAEGMDWAFAQLSNLIAVQPSVLGDSDNGMYVAWNVMRNIANVAFVIAFLIIIYSQLTGYGVSNYGLKKLIPRLIIAAILVNVSFIVSAIAIDISNILGYSIQNVFNAIREDVFHITNDNFAGVNDSPWTTITAVVLANGGVIGGVYFAATGGLHMLVPLLLGLILTLIFVIIVLAARQAIIIILVIIAPLAFVANLLPNTEKWFEKWKDLFMTMLIFFPAFSLVFGGSQLAGQLVIQNAGDNIVMVIFGMAVQIAPLVITPLLLKFSGNLLGRIAQIANNPSKGILDRSKNWANDRAALAKQRNISQGARWYNPASYGSGMVRSMDFRKRRLQDRTNTYKQEGDNLYHASKEYGKLHERMSGAETDRDTIQNRNASHIEGLKVTPGSSLYGRAQSLEASKDSLQAAQNTTNQHFNERRMVSGTALNSSMVGLEASKATLETSENTKAAYLNRQRMVAGSALNRTVEPLEASKLQAENVQSQYATMVESMKLKPSSSLYNVAQDNVASKEVLEAVQGKVQAHFDDRRRVAGTGLNFSTQLLEESKSVSERAKAELATFITDQRVNVGGSLRRVTLDAENAKQVQQISETQLTRMVEEFKSGKVNPLNLTLAELDIMEEMSTNAITANAEKQAITSAQYETQRRIADVMTGSGPLTDAMLNIAQGVGGDTARVRAQAQAVNAARNLDSDALKTNVELLKNDAEVAGTNLKHYSNALVVEWEKGFDNHDGKTITPERLKAALQAQAEQKNVPLLERVKGSERFDQAMVREIFALNGPALMAAGAYGLVDDPTLNIDNFATKEEFDQALNVQRISNLANANSSGLSSLKFGWVANSLAEPENLKNNIESVLRVIQKGNSPDATGDDKKAATAAEASLSAAFKTVRGALLNDDTLADMRDREQFLRTIEAELARIYGVNPLPAESPELKVNADDYATMDLPKQSDVSPDLGETVDGGDDHVPPPTPEQP